MHWIKIKAKVVPNIRRVGTIVKAKESAQYVLISPPPDDLWVTNLATKREVMIISRLTALLEICPVVKKPQMIITPGTMLGITRCFLSV